MFLGFERVQIFRIQRYRRKKECEINQTSFENIPTVRWE